MAYAMDVIYRRGQTSSSPCRERLVYSSGEGTFSGLSSHGHGVALYLEGWEGHSGLRSPAEARRRAFGCLKSLSRSLGVHKSGWDYWVPAEDWDPDWRGTLKQD